MVLKPTDGEAVFGGATLIKASPRTGTQGTELFWSELGIGFSTGIHIHSRADEFFYVVSGTGIALVGGREVEIAPGDFVFVPKGSDHRIRTSGGGPLTIIYWVDRPGLADEFRDAHFASDGGKIALTLEELNRITQKYGTTYKTLE